MNREEGIARMREIVADCLQLDPAEVRPESRLFADLGADSLDYVELTFLFEKEFGVRIEGDDLGALTRLDFSDPEVLRDGFVTEKVLARAREWLPGLATVPDPAHVTPQMLWSMVTVSTLWHAIERRRKGGA